MKHYSYKGRRNSRNSRFDNEFVMLAYILLFIVLVVWFGMSFVDALKQSMITI